VPHYTVPAKGFRGFGQISGTGAPRAVKTSGEKTGESRRASGNGSSVGLEITQAAFEIVQRAFEHLTKTRVLSGGELLPNSLAGKK
jgi:hypothetical protein